MDGAKRFSEEVFGVLFTVLIALTIVMELSMPLLVSTIIAPGFVDNPQKFDLTVALATIMFPYLMCMSLGAMMSRHAEFAAPLFRRGDRAGLPQRHPDRRAGLCLVRGRMTA